MKARWYVSASAARERRRVVRSHSTVLADEIYEKKVPCRCYTAVITLRSCDLLRMVFTLLLPLSLSCRIAIADTVGVSHHDTC